MSKNLLRTKICDLNLDLEQSWMAPLFLKLEKELRAKRITVKPSYWISDDWFCPDDHTGIAIPFFLFSSELRELEKRMMGTCEGETSQWALKLLRHEMGHVIDNAFDIRSRSLRKSLFGDSVQEYPTSYLPKKYSKDFVIHLEDNYAQSHPDEDWAESFALWLTPNSNWRSKFSNKALEKMSYVDSVMRGLKNKKPLLQNNSIVDCYKEDERTLEEYYFEKRKLYVKSRTRYFTKHLRSILSKDTSSNTLASKFIHRNRREIRLKVAKNTNRHQYRIDSMLTDLIDECKSSSLLLSKNESLAKREVVNLLTRKSHNYFKQGRDRIIM